MASSFMGLYVQRDGLNYAQKALDVTGNNISNVNTKGYSRQRLDLTSTRSENSNLLYNSHLFMAGAGVDSPGVTQIRDDIIDNKVRKYSGIVGDLAVKSNVLSDIEDAIDDIENEDSGFAAALKDFKAAIQSFSSNSTDQTDLANSVINKADKVVNVLRNFSVRIDSISDDVIGDTEATVKKINNMLESCAKLNETIKAGYISMEDVYDNGFGFQADTNYGPLELKDEMNLYIDELSQYMNISVSVTEMGEYNISLGNIDLVNGNEFAKVSIPSDPEKVKVNDDGTIEVPRPEPRELAFEVSDLKTAKQWKQAHAEYDAATPEMQKYMDAINKQLDSGNFNNAAELEKKMFSEFPGITLQSPSNPGGYKPIFRDLENADPDDYKLTNATKVITRGALKGDLDMYNGAGDYALDGQNNFKGVPSYKATFDALAVSLAEAFNKIYSDEGIDFKLFEFAPGKEGTAQGLKVSEQWLDNPLGCVHPVNIEHEEISNDYINKMLAVMDVKHKVGKEAVEYSFQDFVAHYGNTIGNQLESINREGKSSEIMLNSVSDARQEVMGVSSDEEGVNMMTYQKWYNAMARMVTTIDSVLDKLINNTGLVGL